MDGWMDGSVQRCVWALLLSSADSLWNKKVSEKQGQKPNPNPHNMDTTLSHTPHTAESCTHTDCSLQVTGGGPSGTGAMGDAHRLHSVYGPPSGKGVSATVCVGWGGGAVIWVRGACWRGHMASTGAY
eukprot:363234-Chlamydomonas_euryale.AAC.8